MNIADDIRNLITNFSLPPREYFTECMLVAETDDSCYYKGGIFICDEASVDFYASRQEFWVRSLYALTENIHGSGYVFNEVVSSIHPEAVPPAQFSEQYFHFLDSFTPETSFLEYQKFAETYTNLTDRKFSDSLNILNDSIISSIATSHGDYVSYFILDDKIGRRHKWPKATKNR